MGQSETKWDMLKKLLINSQLKIANKQLGLLRANPSNNAINFQLENVPNLINSVTNFLPATSTAGASTARTSQKKRTIKNPTKSL